MENNDKIFEQFKKAADNVAPKDFSSMENVWSRVEEKLDNKVLKKETKIWKKIAVAAVLLMSFSIGYQFFITSSTVPKNNNEVVTINKKEKSDTNNENEFPNISEAAKEKLDKSVEIENAVVYNEPQMSENAGPVMEPTGTIQASPPAMSVIEKDFSPEKPAVDKNKDGVFKTKIYEARGVKYASEKVVELKDDKKSSPKKADPLYIIDGEAVAKNKNEDAKSKLDPNNIENIEILKEPLYIINGIQYSENELFGTNPTSPYAPLEKQEIIKTKIYQGEEATDLYGDKGKNGVVVITTKYRRPVGK